MLFVVAPSSARLVPKKRERDVRDVRWTPRLRVAIRRCAARDAPFHDLTPPVVIVVAAVLCRSASAKSRNGVPSSLEGSDVVFLDRSDEVSHPFR